MRAGRCVGPYWLPLPQRMAVVFVRLNDYRHDDVSGDDVGIR